MSEIPLRTIAYARSGDKGSSANIGVIAYTEAGYQLLCEHLSAQSVQAYFRPLGPSRTQRFELPKLGALNFVLHDVLAGGGSLSLRLDSQGKALGQALLEMVIEVPEDAIAACREMD